MGLSPGGIPITEIEAYCRIHGINDASLMATYINAMDEELLSEIAKREKKKSK